MFLTISEKNRVWRSQVQLKKEKKEKKSYQTHKPVQQG
jgi:hypothetical protein